MTLSAANSRLEKELATITGATLHDSDQPRVSHHLLDFEKSILARRLRTDIAKLRSNLAKKDHRILQVAWVREGPWKGQLRLHSKYSNPGHFFLADGT